MDDEKRAAIRREVYELYKRQLVDAFMAQDWALYREAFMTLMAIRDDEKRASGLTRIGTNTWTRDPAGYRWSKKDYWRKRREEET